MRMRPSCKLCGFVQARRILAAAPPRQCPRRLAEADFGRPFPPWTSVVCGCGVLRARCRARRRVTSRLAVADEAPKASRDCSGRPRWPGNRCSAERSPGLGRVGVDDD